MQVAFVADSAAGEGEGGHCHLKYCKMAMERGHERYQSIDLIILYISADFSFF